jgi:isopentenyldiphosphate isomerase
MSMEKLRKQIKESFFNPILHFLPLILFLVVDDFFGMSTAWKVSFPIALILVVYVYFFYNRIFTWHLVFTLVYLAVSIIANAEMLLPITFIWKELVYELVLVLFLFVSIVFRKKIQKIILGIISDLIPMTNNFNELYRVIWTLFLVLLSYIVAFVTLQIIDKGDMRYQHMLQSVYVSVIAFFVVCELLRVKIIRSKLLREEWWPIVNNQGRIVGSIQHYTSLSDENKYMHPVVRLLFVDRSMILLRKISDNDTESPGLWDTTISNHVKMGETIEQCVEKTTKENFSLDNFKYMYLSNYVAEGKYEKQYAFLFVSCQQAEYELNPSFLEQTKWWTQKQIEDNLSESVFTDNFKTEFDLLQRSGLLETGQCECACKLRDVIYSQPNSIKKEDLN